MAEVASLIQAIAFLLLVGGVLFVIYKPPAALRKFKFKDIEGEFHAVPIPPSVAVINTSSVLELGTTEPAPITETPKAELATQAPASEADNFSKIWDLFVAGQFDEGLELANKDLAHEKDPKKAINHRAFYLSFAHSKGSDVAFTELEKHASAHLTNPDVQQWFARSLQRAGRLDEAMKAWESALANADSQSERVSIATSMQLTLSRQERNAEARAVLRKELPSTNAPADRAALYLALARTYESDKPADHMSSLLMRELAIRNTPADKSQRFELAHEYSDHGADELSLVHYRDLVQQDPKYGSGQNNAGVAAERLALPLTSVSYYRAAQALGETLASANLAYRLMHAGFKEEASGILDEAGKAKEVHRNVHLAIGQLAQSEEAEEKKIEKISQRAGKVRTWRVKYAEALLQPDNPIDISGSYNGVPSPLQIAAVSGAVRGTFSTGVRWATLIGKIQGSAVSFNWTESAPEDNKNAFLALSLKSGHGVLLISGEHLDGYWTEGEVDFDSKNVDNWKKWHLTRKTE